MNQTIRALVILTLLTSIFYLYAYGEFWQGRVFAESGLTWQQLLEPIFYSAALLTGQFLWFAFNPT